jgi:hypothetical protein
MALSRERPPNDRKETMDAYTAHPTPKKLTLKKETLRRLTPAELRLAAGGVRRVTGAATLCDG